MLLTHSISKCFRKASILDTDLDVICGDADDKDPFLEANKLLELGRLIGKTGDDGCSSDEFVSGDDDLPVCGLDVPLPLVTFDLSHAPSTYP